jgi:hypothetical protein
MRVGFVFMISSLSASTDHGSTVGGGALRVVHGHATRCVTAVTTRLDHY